MLFKDLKLENKINQYHCTIGGDTDITIAASIPMRDKLDLIQITLQQSETKDGYNEVLLDMYFNLNLIFLYTNIEFTNEDKEDLFALYDILSQNGVVKAVIETISEQEYENLLTMLDVEVERRTKYKISAAGVINRMIQDLPRNAEATAKIMQSFDPDKYAEVLNFAQKANANRPIPQIPDKD